MVTNVYYGLAIVQHGPGAYLRTMNLRNESSVAATQTQQRSSAIGPKNTLTKSTLRVALAVLALGTISMAAEPPNAPSSSLPIEAAIIEMAVPVADHGFVAPRSEVKPVDLKFVSMSLISSGSTFADSYTTLFARQNWLAGKKGVCNVEVQSAYLYGTHPTAGRAYAVASLKSAGSVAAAYYLRKHHNRFWSIPLVANSIIGLQGVTQNMSACN